MLKLLGSKRMLLTIHAAFIAIPAALFLCGENTPHLLEIVCAIIFLNCVALACFFCFASAEMYSVSAPDNKVMSLSFFNTFFCGGRMFGGFISSALLASGMLSAGWDKFGLSFTSIQSVFLMAAAMSCLWLVFLFIVPAVNPDRSKDYYQPPNFRA